MYRFDYKRKQQQQRCNQFSKKKIGVIFSMTEEDLQDLNLPNYHLMMINQIEI